MWGPDAPYRGGKAGPQVRWNAGQQLRHTHVHVCAHTHSPSHPSYLQIFLSLEMTLLSSDSLSDEALLYLKKYSVRVWILGDNFSSRGHTFIAARCGGELSGLGMRGLTFSPWSAVDQLCDLRQLFNQSGPQFPHLFREGWSWTGRPEVPFQLQHRAIQMLNQDSWSHCI